MAGFAVATGFPLFLSNACKTRVDWLHKQFTPTIPAFLSSDQQQHGTLALVPLRSNPVRCYDTKRDVPPEYEETKKTSWKFFGKDTIANAVEKFAPAVVDLYAKNRGLNVPGEIGSGTIIHKDGFILTCAHVVLYTEGLVYSADGKVLVRLQNGEECEGTLVDAYIDIDIAIVKIDPSSSPLSTAELGSSSKLRVGDWAVAMGCPNSLQNTVTLGIISCVHRKSCDLNLPGTPKEYLQTDCVINEGNSGGPLCNIDGEVVGVNITTTNNKTASGISFAVPIDHVATVIKPFREIWTPARPGFGWVVRDIDEVNVMQLRKIYPNFPKVEEGVFVHKVMSGSPADRAGIQPNDVVVEFNGRRVRSIIEIMDALGNRSGIQIKVVVKRANDALFTLYSKEKVVDDLPNTQYIKT